MPILSHVGRRSISQRLIIGTIYTVLSVLGLTMVVPFMMTVSASLSNTYDYVEFRPIPRYFYSQKDRFVKGLVGFFDYYKGYELQMAAYFPTVPPEWSAGAGGWLRIGQDTQNIDALAQTYLGASPAVRKQTETMAHDYADFAETYPVDDCLTPVDPVLVSGYLEEKFEARWAAAHPDEAARMSSSERQAAALRLLSETYQIPYTEFYQVAFGPEMQMPYTQESWTHPIDPKYETYLELKQAYRDLEFSFGMESKWGAYLESHHMASQGVSFPVPAGAPAAQRDLWLAFKREVSPATPTIPFAMRVLWHKYLLGQNARKLLNLDPDETFDVDHYNELAGTSYKDLNQTPFPLPPDAPAPLAALWKAFTEKLYPIRLMSITVTPELTAQYQNYLQTRYKTVSALNTLIGTSFTQWSDFALSPELPVTSTEARGIWVNFVKSIPIEQRALHSSEAAFQQFMLQRYGTLDGINRAWGTHYQHIEEVFPPFDKAYAVTFAQNEWFMTLSPALRNYYIIFNYLFSRSNAVWVTLLLIAMHIICVLTVNPFAAYSLSRFNLRRQKEIIVYLLATSAFPAIISAIPGFLLLRDLGMLNTYWALVIPGAASGFSIFILKGFFDSLPPELFEAATIDGAKEWQIFVHVMMPMVKPILAIHCLHAFIAAYTGWAWALIVCQDKHMWTLAVWMYQASQMWAATPWVVDAGFIIMSIPTLIVFLTCQNVILRGIIIPTMK